VNATTIAAAVPRRRATFRGSVVSVVSAETPTVRTDAVIDDGTGRLVLRFIGRSSVPGIEPGRHVVVEGTPGVVAGHPVVVNPRYSFDGAG
jgi:hypothetical protein